MLIMNTKQNIKRESIIAIHYLNDNNLGLLIKKKWNKIDFESSLYVYNHF